MSKLQKDFWNNAHKARWAIKQGATRSGKTYLDYFYIVKCIRACKGNGQIVILGHTKSTIKRNIIEPMQEIWGEKLVSNINNENISYMFGKRVYCLGADKSNSVAKIQGMTIEFVYGDEITTWNEDMFQMLKSRLSCPNSRFVGTCNPDSPYHWFKTFLDSDADIFTQVYTLDDNPFLSKEFVANLKAEYRGTVYYDRFVLGLWALAEGLVFPMYANDNAKWAITYEEALQERINYICIGLDVGGTNSHTTFVASGIVGKYEKVIHLYDKKLKHEKGYIDVGAIQDALLQFIEEVEQIYSKFAIKYVFVDNAEQVILNSLISFNKQVMKRAILITDCKKYESEERIKAYIILFNTNRLLIVDKCQHVQESYSTMIRDENGKLLDNGTTDVDTYDGAFYSWSYFLDYYVYKGGR